MSSNVELSEYDRKLSRLIDKTRCFFKECLRKISYENKMKIHQVIVETIASKASLNLSGRAEFIWAVENLLMLSFEMSRFSECKSMWFNYFLNELNEDEQEISRIFLKIISLNTFLVK